MTITLSVVPFPDRVYLARSLETGREALICTRAVLSFSLDKDSETLRCAEGHTWQRPLSLPGARSTVAPTAWRFLRSYRTKASETP